MHYQSYSVPQIELKESLIGQWALGKRSKDVTWVGLVKRERCFSVFLSYQMVQKGSNKYNIAIKKGKLTPSRLS